MFFISSSQIAVFSQESESAENEEGVENTEEEEELAAAFGIRSIPSILFCPMDSQPQMAMGALPKATFKQAISEVLLGNKVEA